MMDHRIEARIAALETELNSLKALVSPKEESGPVTSDRRGMMKLMAANVRAPEPVLGDIHAQVAGNDVGGRRLVEFMR
jgi:hypothetical protein